MKVLGIFRSFLLRLTLVVLISPLSASAEPSAPDFSLPSHQGTISLIGHRGKVVYLDFWASWCPPCRISLPWMADMQKKYGTRGLKVIAINLDTSKEERESAMASITQSTTEPFTVAFDPEAKTPPLFEVKAMPSSFIIDRNGVIIAKHEGFKASEMEKLEAEIVAALEAP